MPLCAGSICLIEYPFTDKAVAKLRPVLVAEPLSGTFLALTDGEGSPASQHAVFIPITSKIIPGPYNIVIEQSSPYFQFTGLNKPSTILCWNINTIHKAFIKHEIGCVPVPLMEQVRERLRALLNL